MADKLKSLAGVFEEPFVGRFALGDDGGSMGSSLEVKGSCGPVADLT